jgi:hypothetical protein
MSTFTNWDANSQPALHDYIENTFVVPRLIEIHKSVTLDAEQYAYNRKNADRKFVDAEGKVITIERKIDRSDKSDDFAFEIFCNLKLNQWNEVKGRVRTNNASAHKKALSKIIATRLDEDFDQNNAGLLTANLKGLGKHYSQVVRYYPHVNRAECWLVSTRWLQAEVIQNLKNIDVGKVWASKHGNRWDTVLAFVSMPSVVRNAPLNIDGDSIVANWELPIESYHRLVTNQ